MDQLSSGFFNTWNTQEPKLQVLLRRGVESSLVCLRLHCFDGELSYDQIGVAKNLEEKVLEYGLVSHKFDPIISVQKYGKIGCTMIIEDYIILQENCLQPANVKRLNCSCHQNKRNEILNSSETNTVDQSDIKEEVLPIGFLSIYLVYRFAIMGIVSKGKLNQTFSSKNGPLKFSVFTLTGYDGKEIEVKTFGRCCKMLENLVIDGTTLAISYIISSVRTRIIQRSKAAEHEYEIVLSFKSNIVRVV